MVKLNVQKEFFHNHKHNQKNLELNIVSHIQTTEIKENVDINKLLNRIKIDQGYEKKQKVIFFFLGILLLSSVGTFTSILG